MPEPKGDVAVLPLFIIDPWFCNPDYVGVNRYQFLLETLQDIDTTLKQQMGLRLVIAKGGQPAEIFKQLAEEFDIKLLTFEKDTEPYALKRDEDVTKVFENSKTNIETFGTHTLFDLDHLFSENGNVCPNAYNSFLNILSNNKMCPKKPINTFEGYKAGDFQLPKAL